VAVPLANKLPDEQWVASQRAQYEQKTGATAGERDALAKELNRVLDTRPRTERAGLALGKG